MHYHYDTKGDLLAAFLNYILSEFRETIQVNEFSYPEHQLLALVDVLLYGPEDSSNDEIFQMQAALLEIQSQSTHKQLYRDQFTQLYYWLNYLFIETINNGINEDIFRDVDPKLTAQHLLLIIVGGLLNRHTTNTEMSPDRIRVVVTSQFLPYLKK